MSSGCRQRTASDEGVGKFRRGVAVEFLLCGVVFSALLWTWTWFDRSIEQVRHSCRARVGVVQEFEALQCRVEQARDHWAPERLVSALKGDFHGLRLAWQSSGVSPNLVPELIEGSDGSLVLRLVAVESPSTRRDS